MLAGPLWILASPHGLDGLLLDYEHDYALSSTDTGTFWPNIAGPDGKRMRCEFPLIRAAEGGKGRRRAFDSAFWKDHQG